MPYNAYMAIGAFLLLVLLALIFGAIHKKRLDATMREIENERVSRERGWEGNC